ncbi:MAG TPA: hypothetical protein VEU30_14225 [Thermoanaerobaculia bacterium]|nr:hypothetical protein [Thermoanaerobaculia bacterium]
MAYYSLGLNALNISTAAYYQIQPTRDLSILQGGFTCVPTETARTSVAIYPQLAQLNFPAAEYASGSVTIVTDLPAISGNLTVSPAINSPVTLTLYGGGGNPIGTATLEAGQTSLNFKFDVGVSSGMSEEEARGALEASLSQQQ